MPRPQVNYQAVERGITKIVRTYADGCVVESFQIRYAGSDRRMQSDSSFTTKAKARAALARARTQVNDGNHISPGSADTKFLEVAEDWLASNPHWRIKTRVANEGTVPARACPAAGQAHEAAQHFGAGRLPRGVHDHGHVERHTTRDLVRRTMTVLNSIFEHARRRKHIASNPGTTCRN